MPKAESDIQARTDIENLLRWKLKGNGELLHKEYRRLSVSEGGIAPLLLEFQISYS